MKTRFTTIISAAYFVIMLGCFLFFWMKEDSYRYPIALGGMAASILPPLIEWKARSPLKKPLILSYFIFLIGSQVFGSLMRFYDLGWWDTFLHVVSGGLIAFAALACLEHMTAPAARNGMSRGFIFLFLLSVSVFGGVLWEVYEFSADQLFGTQTQSGGNTDTMGDLIADTLGGLAVSGYLAWKQKK